VVFWDHAFSIFPSHDNHCDVSLPIACGNLSSSTSEQDPLTPMKFARGYFMQAGATQSVLKRHSWWQRASE